jgi:hypothetical protein
VIPTAWVKAAQERWKPRPAEGAMMTAMGVDVAQGGGDRTVISCRYGPWFAPLKEKPGILTPTGSEVAAFVVVERRDNAIVIVDMGGGYGGGAKLRLGDNDVAVRPFNGANHSGERSKDRQLAFVNKRSEVHWRFREALDPDQEHGSPIALPPDPQLLADLTAPRWKLMARGIQVEDKDVLKKSDRLGRSPDKGDAVMMAWSEGEKSLIIAQKKALRAANQVTPLQIPKGNGSLPGERGTGWMNR